MQVICDTNLPNYVWKSQSLYSDVAYDDARFNHHGILSSRGLDVEAVRGLLGSWHCACERGAHLHLSALTSFVVTS